MPLSTTEIKQALTTIATTAARGVSTATGGAPPPGGPQGVFDVSNDGLTWRPTVRVRAGSGTSFSVVDGEATVTAAALGEAEYATRAIFRASPPPADGAIFRIVSPPGEYRYSVSSGAGWADDDDTILKPDSILVGANGRAFSTRASEHAATFAAARAMKGILGRAKHVHIESHTTFGDGGGDVFDVKDNSGGAYTDDDGIYIEAGDAALVRRGALVGPVKNEWWGTDRTGATDITSYLTAKVASLAVGQKLKLPKGNYKITDTITIATSGIHIEGEGGLNPDPGTTGTTLLAYLPTWSGSAATIDSVATNTPTGELALVRLTGLGSITGVDPGDTIHISGAALEENNGYFTILSVGAGEIVFYGRSTRVHVSRYQWLVTPTGETNNGSLVWEIRKPVIRCTGRDVEFRSIAIDGRDTAACCVDSTTTGTGGVPSGANTNYRFVDCVMARAFDILKIGDFSGYVASASSFQWANNHDLYRFRNCLFKEYDHAGICIPNATSNSMLHDFQNTTCAYGEIGVYARRASFRGPGLNFTWNTGSDVVVEEASGPSHLIGISSEHSACLLVLGIGGYLSGSAQPYPFIVESARFGSSDAELAADGCVIRTNCGSGLSVRNCSFGTVPGRMTIGIQGYNTPAWAVSRQVALSIEGCYFPSDTVEGIVTSKVGAPGIFSAWYYSCGNSVYQGTTAAWKQVPAGIIPAASNPTNVYPQTRVGNLCTPSSGITLVNGANNSIANPYRSSVTATGPTADVTLGGIAAGEHGQRLRIRLSYNYQTTIAHMAAGAASGAKIMTPSASDVVLFAPGASPAYHTIEFEYDSTADSGNGAWVVL